MSGVIDKHGQQWEHCHTCGKFVRFPQDLGYEADLRHICLACTNNHPDIESITPAPSWIPQYEGDAA